TKIIRPILEWARVQGIRFSTYLDDWLTIIDTKNQAVRHTNLLLQKLQDLSWLVNIKKSQLFPIIKLEHLEYQLDTTIMIVHLLEKKLRDSRRSICQVLRSPIQFPRLVHSLTMRI
ncbi:hypothetical protein BCV71DRAFT_177714, partial [Rhizopus microsporus]